MSKLTNLMFRVTPSEREGFYYLNVDKDETFPLKTIVVCDESGLSNPTPESLGRRIAESLAYLDEDFVADAELKGLKIYPAPLAIVLTDSIYDERAQWVALADITNDPELFLAYIDIFSDGFENDGIAIYI